MTPEERARHPVLKVGERECPWCSGVFEVDDMRRHHCPGTNCAKLHYKEKQKVAGGGLDHLTETFTPPEWLSKAAYDPPLSGWAVL
jgi:hypothetical protein